MFYGAAYAADPAAKANDDAEKIQGSWKIESAQNNGRTSPADANKLVTIVISADKLSLKVGGQTVGEMTYKLDAAHGWIDLVDIRERVKRVGHGIYELKGDDLKVCYPETSNERSTAFESKSDNSPNDVLLMLKREKT